MVVTTVLIDDVWRRITGNAGQQFRQKLGKPFTYSIRGNTIELHTTNRMIPRSDLERALGHVPFASTTIVNRLAVQAPSYVFAILMDPRVRKSDW